MDRFLGFPYPVTKNSKGYFYSQSDINQIKSDMLILLLTSPGERVMNPRYGTPLKELFFEPNDPRVASEAKKMIVRSLKSWEPRVAIKNVEVSSKAEANTLNDLDDKSELQHILFIRIQFVDPTEIQSVQELTLEVPLSGE